MSEWKLKHELRRWQQEALEAWLNELRGVVAVVTGAGKTFLALRCMQSVNEKFPDTKFLIIVPSIALLDQWHVSLTQELGVSEDQIGLAGGGGKLTHTPPIIIAVLNSARSIPPYVKGSGRWFLIVDECHRVASEANRRILEGSYFATLGLSATPERQYDNWFYEYVTPVLGPVIYTYSYEKAKKDRVIADFDLWNIRIPLTPEEEENIHRINTSIAKELSRLKKEKLKDSDKLRILLQKRSRMSQSASARISTTIALLEQWRGKRGIIFHESIESANRITELMYDRGHRVRAYHSGISEPRRYENLRLYCARQIDVLITCRALDEGFDVPSTEYGIIAASTASNRQRVQRLGRILRPTPGKDRATIMTLYALPSEGELLSKEASRVEDIASVRWFEVLSQ